MTQTQIEQTRVIAEWDGWELRGEPDFIHPYKIWIKQMQTGTKMIPYISPSGKEYDGWHKDMKYLTSLDWLHPVAMNVLTELRNIQSELIDNLQSMIYDMNPIQEDIIDKKVLTINKSHKSIRLDECSRIINSILLACQIPRIEGTYISLFNAVYEGIVYLKKQG
jgi:hypothetical protein